MDSHGKWVSCLFVLWLCGGRECPTNDVPKLALFKYVLLVMEYLRGNTFIWQFRILDVRNVDNTEFLDFTGHS